MSRDEARARFAAAIPAKDPNRDARLRAFERMSIDPCEGVDIKPGIDAKQLMEEAAAGGDPKARIARLARQMGERSQKDNFRTQLLDADIAELKSIIASDDILAIRRAWSTLNQPYYENASLRFGPDQAEIDNRAFDAALSLLMCDMGTDCSRSSFLLATVCLAGQCAAHDMREYLFTYQLSAMSAQLVDEYLAGLRRVRAGDWSSFTVYPGPTSTFVAVRAR